MRKKLKMRDLERATGVGREAIRFYIREGLLPEPDRPARNVAWYDDSFVERILLIRRLQQERYLPLAVIKGILRSDLELSAKEMQAVVELQGKLVPASERGHPRVAQTIAAVAETLGVRAQEILELADAGFVEITDRDGDRWLEGNSLAIVEAWVDLRRRGLTPELGFVPETFALYAQFVDWLAREEIRLFASRVADKVDPERSRRMAEAGIDGMNRILSLMRESKLLRLIDEGALGVPRRAAESSRAVGS